MTEREENDLITEKLLGWQRKPVSWAAGWEWRKPNGERIWHEGPDYLCWAAAGLILEALAKQGISHRLHCDSMHDTPTLYLMTIYTPTARHNGAGTHGPLAIRAAALQYLHAREHEQAGHA